MSLAQKAENLKAAGMRCNCDLDNWEPEASTGHSWVCRIHRAAVGMPERQKPVNSAYDAYVTARTSCDDDWEPDCCSCHISAPCGYCISHCAECGEHVDDCECIH